MPDDMAGLAATAAILQRDATHENCDLSATWLQGGGKQGSDGREPPLGRPRHNLEVRSASCNTATCRRFLGMPRFDSGGHGDRSCGRSLLAGNGDRMREQGSLPRGSAGGSVQVLPRNCHTLPRAPVHRVSAAFKDFSFHLGDFLPGFRLQHTTHSSQLASHRRLTFWPAKWVQPLNFKRRGEQFAVSVASLVLKILHTHTRVLQEAPFLRAWDR
jgi:hypothetical protein